MLKGKDIFVPRNSERYEEIKKPYIEKGYKAEQIFVGTITELDQLKGIKVIIGNISLVANGKTIQFMMTSNGMDKIDVMTGWFANSCLESIRGMSFIERIRLLREC